MAKAQLTSEMSEDQNWKAIFQTVYYVTEVQYFFVKLQKKLRQ